MAMEVVETLRALCAGGRTVALTIHQPNSLITAKFDDFILLAAGRAVFGGAWADAAPFFAAGGHALPPATNPTDFFLAVLQDSAAAEALADRQADRAALAAAAPAPADVEAAGGKGGAGGEDLVPLAVAAAEVPFFYQAWVLMLRYVRSYIRNPAMLGAELAQYLFMVRGLIEARYLFYYYFLFFIFYIFILYIYIIYYLFLFSSPKPHCAC
jgi:hypothetical protein